MMMDGVKARALCVGLTRSYTPDFSQERWGDSVPSYSGYRYFICHRGKVRAGRKTIGEIAASYGTWTLDTSGGYLRLYATCPQCAGVNDLSEHLQYIASTGKICSVCVICQNCAGHFFPELVGWKRKFEEKIHRRVRVKR